MIAASHRESARNLPLDLLICQTDPVIGMCINPSPGPSSPPISATVANNETVTFSVFVKGNGTAIPYDPANMRIYLLAMQRGTTVGEASAAVKMTTGAGAAQLR